MQQDNFGRLFLVALAFVSFQLAVCVPGNPVLSTNTMFELITEHGLCERLILHVFLVSFHSGFGEQRENSGKEARK